MIKIVILFSLLFFTATGSASAQNSFKKVFSDDKSSFALKVLFIGNSIIYVGETPEVFTDLSRAMEPNKPLKIVEVAGPSFTLQQHIGTGMAIDEITNNGPWDYVIIQPQSNEFAGPVKDSTLQSLNTLVQAAKQVRATPLLYEWFAASSTEAHKSWHKNVMDTASRLGVGVIPVRSTMAYLLQQNPRISMQSDGTHFNDTGVYMALCVIYSKLTGKNPSNIPTAFTLASGRKLEVQHVDARAIQEMSAKVVQSIK